jgi:hypothetical protein
MSVTISQLPNSPGLSVTAYVQGGPAAIGVQQSTLVGLLAVNFPTSSVINPAAVSEQFTPATLPSPAVIYQFTAADETAVLELTVPFKCKVIFASGIKVGLGDTGDQVEFLKKPLAAPGTPVAISNAISLAVSDKAVFTAASIDSTTNTLEPGDVLQASVTQGAGICSCELFVTVIPVA